jgi:GTP cyclohydrolase III
MEIQESVDRLAQPTATDKQEIYFLIDGDQIGDRLQLMLMDNNPLEAQRFSTTVSNALLKIKDRLISARADIIFIAGDEMLGTLPAPEARTSLFDDLRKLFHERTDCTLSIGLGFDARSALESLRRAKLSGRNKVIGGPTQ